MFEFGASHKAATGRYGVRNQRSYGRPSARRRAPWIIGMATSAQAVTSKDQRVFKRPARDGAELMEDESWRRNLSFEA